MEVIITDTVGFIENLPKDLIVAFRATLEEAGEADALSFGPPVTHVVT